MTDADRRRRIDDLCHAALELDPPARAGFLAAACIEDDALRRDVEQLLAHAGRAERFLTAPITAVAAEVFAAADASPLGRTIGAYRIEAFLGAGGMGEVYRAHDNRLDRDVAFKVVADASLADPERLARFEREARVLAALNHPHIGAIYGFEEADGVRGLVLELVDGETLAERLARGPLPMPEALEVARQIAEAIEMAHDKGVIHRDLKPANVSITSAGVTKVLDFGLAKVLGTDAAIAGEPSGPENAAPSHDGRIAGTPAYMSPEQARGTSVDTRTDIWSFGCVVFEMISGRPAFGGATAVDTIADVLEREPDWRLLPAETPSSIRRLIERCLTKERKQRLRDIGDARLEIEDVLRVRTAGAALVAHPRADPQKISDHQRRVPWSAALVGAVLLATGSAIAVTWMWPPSASVPRNPLDGAKVARVTDFAGAEHHAAISRDGKFVAFLSDRDGPWDAWVSQVGTGRIYNLTNGQVRELRNPATRTVGFSPDGSLVALWSRVPDTGSVDAGWAVPTLGGPLQHYLQGVSELDWSPDGTRIVYHPPAEGDPLFVTTPNEKVGRQMFAARPGIHNHFPLWSHDGRFVYFVHGLPEEENDIWRMRSDGGEPERLTFHDSRVTFPTVLNDSTLLYLATDAEGGGPWIYSLDVNRRTSRRISTGLERYVSLAASANGRRLVATVSRSVEQLWRAPIADAVVDESQASALSLPTTAGLAPRIGLEAIFYRAPKTGSDAMWKVGPDGGGIELWGGASGRLVGAPAIAPDGQRLAFGAQSGGRTQLYVMNADGTGTRRVAEALDVRGAPSWSPDGQSVAVAVDVGGEPHVFKVPLDGGAPTELVREYSTDPTWSPTGRFLVYSGADVGTTFPVKAVNADGTPHVVPRVVLTRGARRLVFLREETLILLKGDISHKDFWAVDLRTGRERQLTSLRRGPVIGDFDITRDGRAIIFDRTREESDIVLFDLFDP